MDYGRLIQRSFEITFRYRALWIFGILFSLFGSGGGPNANYSLSRQDFNNPAVTPFPTIPSIPQNTLLGIIAAIACVFLIVILLAFILHLIGRGALIGLAHELETKQVEPRFRHGWDIGTGKFMPLLGIALLVNIPLAIVSILLLIVAVLPFLGSMLPLINAGGRNVPSQAVPAFMGGIFVSIGLFCCIALVLFVVGLVIRPIYEFAVRACVIADVGVMESLRVGYRKVRANLGKVAILFLLVIGLAIGYWIVMIPITLLLVVGPAVLAISAYVMANSLTPAIIVAVVLGIPIFILLLIINGFYHAFENNLWTEGYMALDQPVAPVVPAAPENPVTPVPAQG